LTSTVQSDFWKRQIISSWLTFKIRYLKILHCIQRLWLGQKPDEWMEAQTPNSDVWWLYRANQKWPQQKSSKYWLSAKCILLGKPRNVLPSQVYDFTTAEPYNA